MSTPQTHGRWEPAALRQLRPVPDDGGPPRTGVPLVTPEETAGATPVAPTADEVRGDPQAGESAGAAPVAGALEAQAGQRTRLHGQPGPAQMVEPARLIEELSRRPGQSGLSNGLGHLRGLVGADDRPGRLAAAWATVQTPVATGRRVWVTGAHGGAGTSTVAVALGQQLHLHRRDGAALVDASSGRVGFAGRLALPPQADVPTGVTAVWERSSFLLCFTPAGPRPEDAEELATRLRRSAGVTLTDGGTALPPDRQRVEVLVVVAEQSVRGLEALDATLREAADAGWPAQQVVTAVCQTSTTTGLSGETALRLVERSGTTGHLLSHDRHLAGAARISPGLLSAAALLDLAELGATVVDRAVGSR